MPSRLGAHGRPGPRPLVSARELGVVDRGRDPAEGPVRMAEAARSRHAVVSSARASPGRPSWKSAAAMTSLEPTSYFETSYLHGVVDSNRRGIKGLLGLVAQEEPARPTPPGGGRSPAIGGSRRWISLSSLSRSSAREASPIRPSARSQARRSILAWTLAS